MPEPTDAMITAAIASAKATEKGRALGIDDLPDDGLTFMFQQAVFAALNAANPSDLPAYEPSTCGSDHLSAERALRVIERATLRGESMSCDAMEQIYKLADRAGSAMNREALRRHNQMWFDPF